MIDHPLRFCMITTFYPPHSLGGDGIFVQRLSNELAQRGHKVDVIHCIDSYRIKSPEMAPATKTDHPNVTVHSLKSGVGVFSPLATQQTGFPLFKSKAISEILSRPFDVIHYHNISLVGGPDILSRGHGIKLYTTHEYWLVCPTHLLFKFNREPCEVRSCLACSLVHKRPPQLWRHTRLLDNAVANVDAFISPSRFGAEIHRQNGFSAPFVHLPSFAPRTANKASPLEDKQTTPYFLFVGRLEKLKGLQTILPVFKRHKHARLLVAGTGTYEARLRRMASGANVRFLGHVREPELQGLYRNAIAVVVPSICYEIFPLVMIEAFSQKTPVIARRLGGMTEVIEDSSGGILYQSDHELISAMDQLMSDPARRNELGARGYQAYERNWTAEAHLERYFALIESIAVRRQQAAG